MSSAREVKSGEGKFVKMSSHVHHHHLFHHSEQLNDFNLMDSDSSYKSNERTRDDDINIQLIEIDAGVYVKRKKEFTFWPIGCSVSTVSTFEYF